MAKRFIDTSRYRQAWRKLDPKFRAAYGWMVENADAAGFWIIDLEHFKFECGYTLDLEKFLRDIAGAIVRHGAQKLRVVDFIEVNYGALREGYNPHKPALRALEASKLDSSLKQAQGNDEEEDEEEGEDEERVQETDRAHEAELWPTFKDWWELYAKSRNRGDCEAIWAKLDHATHEAIYRHTEEYVIAEPDKLYRKDPIRYLQKRCWMDEIVHKKSTTKTQTHADRKQQLAESFAKSVAERRSEAAGAGGGS